MIFPTSGHTLGNSHSANRRAEACVTRISCTACNEQHLRAACATPSGISPPSACYGDGDQTLHQLTLVRRIRRGVRAMPLAASSLRRVPSPPFLRTPQKLATIAREIILAAIQRPFMCRLGGGLEQALWTVLSHRSTRFLVYTERPCYPSNLPRVERSTHPFPHEGGGRGLRELIPIP